MFLNITNNQKKLKEKLSVVMSKLVVWLKIWKIYEKDADQLWNTDETATVWVANKKINENYLEANKLCRI